MKIAITTVSDPKDALLALGVQTFLASLGIGSEMQADFSGAIFEAVRTFDGDPEPAVPAPLLLPAAPVKRKYTKRAAAKPAPKPEPHNPKRKRGEPAPATDAPRVTIRQRILDCLKRRPQTAHEVALSLGLGDGVNIPQHLYLIGRDRLAKRNDDTNVWSLVA